MPDDADFQQRMRKVESLIQEIEAAADPQLRRRTADLVALLMELHGAGLARMVELLRPEAAAGQGAAENDVVGRFAQEPLVASLLLLHGLHPVELEVRVGQALDQVRPLLRSHGGDVELLAIEEGVVRLRLVGSCHGCPSSTQTLRNSIEEAIYALAPDVVELNVEGAVPAASPASAKSPLDGAWTGRLRAGGTTGMTLPEPSLDGPTRKLRIAAQTASPGRPLATLRRFLGQAGAQSAAERCELCSTPLPTEHQHLIDPRDRRVVCSCDACAVLFDAQSAGRYRRVPRRGRRLPDFVLADAQWDDLLIPVNMAFVFHSSAQGKVVAMYPSPAGATESLLSLETWQNLVAANPVLRTMQSDVEALLVNRLGSVHGFPAAEYFLAPIDQCFRLSGLMRGHWRGMSGGTEVWLRIAEFFAELAERSLAEPAVP